MPVRRGREEPLEKRARNANPAPNSSSASAPGTPRRIQTLSEFSTSPWNGRVRTSLARSISWRARECRRFCAASSAASASGSRLPRSWAAIRARLSADAERVSSIANRPKLTSTTALASTAM